MNDQSKIEVIKRLGGWERLVIFSGVIISVPLFALFGTAVYALMVDRPNAYMGVLLSIIGLLVLWLIVWGMLWIVTGFKGIDANPLLDPITEYEKLAEENARLRKLLEEKTGDPMPDEPDE